MKTRPVLRISKSPKFPAKCFKEPDQSPSEIMNSASTACSFKKKKWRRKRKNTSQVKVLIEEFNKNSLWTKEQVVFLAEKTGLSEAQVYKWGWDYKKKLRKQAVQFNARELLCGEVMPPSKLDLDLVSVQRSYKEFICMNIIVPVHLAF
jgi:hypothetical protein